MGWNYGRERGDRARSAHLPVILPPHPLSTLPPFYPSLTRIYFPSSLIYRLSFSLLPCFLPFFLNLLFHFSPLLSHSLSSVYVSLHQPILTHYYFHIFNSSFFLSTSVSFPSPLLLIQQLIRIQLYNFSYLQSNYHFHIENSLLAPSILFPIPLLLIHPISFVFISPLPCTPFHIFPSTVRPSSSAPPSLRPFISLSKFDYLRPPIALRPEG